MYICAGEIEQFDFAKPVGIGMIDTAVNLVKLCEKESPEEIVFIGTAGSYGNCKVFDVAESHAAVTVENSYFNAGAYTPMVSRETSLEMPVDPSGSVVVNSSNYITTDEKIAHCYLDEKIEIENMEFFAVLRTARLLGVPARGIFIVTNYCNQTAHEDFLRNHQEAMKRLTRYVKSMAEKV